MPVTIREINQDDIKTIKPWLIDKDNAQWLDPFFQNETLRDEQIALFLMRRDKKNYLALCDDIPVGIVGFNDIDLVNRSAHNWVLMGNREFRKKGLMTTALILALKRIFDELDLNSINIWIVDGNISIKTAENVRYKYYGRQRECHLINGVLRDRLHLDMVRTEFEEFYQTYLRQQQS
jgi:RimJ/RimL family protein N-acetyltransferase